jgi:hypothetical protein
MTPLSEIPLDAAVKQSLYSLWFSWL